MNAQPSFTNVLKSLALAAVAAFFGTTPAHANYITERAVEQLTAQFLEVGLIYTAKGYELHDFEPVELDAGDTHRFRIYLDAGDQVILRGMGDRDAADLDLVVHDPRGRRVAQDIDRDATPVAQFTARRSGYYVVALSLPECHDRFSFAGLLLATR